MNKPRTEKSLPCLAAFACGMLLATLITNYRYRHMRDEFHRNLSHTLTLASLQSAVLETEVNPRTYPQGLSNDLSTDLFTTRPEPVSADFLEIMRHPARIQFMLSGSIGQTIREQRAGIERGHPTEPYYDRLVHLLNTLQVRYLEAMEDSPLPSIEPARRPGPAAPVRLLTTLADGKPGGGN